MDTAIKMLVEKAIAERQRHLKAVREIDRVIAKCRREMKTLVELDRACETLGLTNLCSTRRSSVRMQILEIVREAGEKGLTPNEIHNAWLHRNPQELDNHIPYRAMHALCASGQLRRDGMRHHSKYFAATPQQIFGTQLSRQKTASVNASASPTRQIASSQIGQATTP